MTTPPLPEPVPDPQALLTDHARLSGAELVLDPARLSALLGREVTLDRVRIKPTAGVLISYRAAGSSITGVRGRDLADVGWAQMVDSRDKRDGILRRAARGGIEVTEHPAATAATAGRAASPGRADAAADRAVGAGSAAAPVADSEAPYLLSGGIDSDPRLGQEIRSVLRRLRSGATPRVLSYNPGRHVVLMLPASGEVLRVAGRPLDHLQQVSRQWRDLGLPTAAQERWKNRSTVLVSDHWGHGDLAGMADHPQAREAASVLGGVIAELHAADVAGQELPAARIGVAVPSTTGAAADLLPHRAAQIGRLSQRLQGAIGEQGSQTLIHGDLSPDQVLLTPASDPASGPASEPASDPAPVPASALAVEAGHGPGAPHSAPQIRVVDLDRSGLGPRSVDLGSWLAACLLTDDQQQAAAFLAGYADRLPLPPAEQLAAWTARALLSAALDPMRRYSENWLVKVEQRLDLAAAVLDRPQILPLPPPSAVPGAPGAGSTSAETADAGSFHAGALYAGATGEESRTSLVPAHVEHEGRRLRVRRAWADDGRGMPLELEDQRPREGTTAAAALRAGRLDPATGEVTVFEPGTDPRLPALARVLAEHPGGVIVSHRPGKRAVVRIPGAGGRSRYVKIVRRGRTQKLLAAVSAARAFDGPFRTPQVLDRDEEIVIFAELPGRLLHEGLPIHDGTWRRAWRDTLDAWATAVQSSRDHLLPVEVHGPAEEARVLESWQERAAAADPGGAEVRGRAVEAALSELGRLPEPVRPALIHRDLHDKQILWRPGERPALLDVDTVTSGDPALDAANLRAHATWRELQGIWTAAQAAVAREEIDSAAGRVGVAPQSLAAYESATIARLACVYAFRPQWRQAATALAVSLLPDGPDGPDGAGGPDGPDGAAGASGPAGTGTAAGPAAPAHPAAPAPPAAPPSPAASVDPAAPPGPAAPAHRGPSTSSRTTVPAAAGYPTSLGGAATHLERSMSR